MSESTPGLAYYLGQKSLEQKAFAPELDAMTPTPLPVGVKPVSPVKPVVARLRAPTPPPRPKALEKAPERLLPVAARAHAHAVVPRASAKPQMVRGLTMSRSAFAGFCLTAFACGIVTTVAVDRIRPGGDDSARAETTRALPAAVQIAPALEVHELAPPAPPPAATVVTTPAPEAGPARVAATAPRPAAPVAAARRQQPDIGRVPEKTPGPRQVNRAATSSGSAPARKHAPAAAARPEGASDAPTETWSDPFE